MSTFKNKTIFITGASRGIGLAIAKRLASDGANIVIAAKSVTEDPRIPGTIYTAAEEVESAGGSALAVALDVRDEVKVEEAIAATVERFGGIDILVNNASAIALTPTEMTQMKRYDLMHQINLRGTFLCSQKALPHLKNADNPHVLNLSPPISLDPKWYGNHVAYTIAKMGMSMCALGMAEEYRDQGIAFNTLWPRTTIATAAVANFPGGEGIVPHSRTPEVMADAAYEIFSRSSRECTGNHFLDEEVLRESGVTDFDKYAVDSTKELMVDLYVDP